MSEEDSGSSSSSEAFLEEELYDDARDDELLGDARGDDYTEDEDLREGSLRKMLSWMQANADAFGCSNMEAGFLLRFLRVKNFDVMRAQEALVNYLRMKRNHPSWFSCLDCYDAKIDALIDAGVVFVLPERDRHGRSVIFSIARNIDTKVFKAEDTVRAFLTTCEALLENEEDQIRGFTYVFDSRDVGWSFLSLWTPRSAQMVITSCEANLPMRHKEVNVVNVPFTFLAVYEFVRSLLSEKMRSRLKVSRNQNTLLASLPRRILPLEYGGEVPIRDMIVSWKAVLTQRRDRVVRLDRMASAHEAQEKLRQRSLEDCLQDIRISQ